MSTTKLQEKLDEAWRLRREQVAFMRDVQKMTFQDIADSLGVTRARAYQLYMKAKRDGR